jgi:putative addiction module CopG family antidote
MAAASKRTISLPVETAEYIDAKVASGEYASASEVVRDGLRILQERERVLEKWLREQVVPAAIAHEAHPERAISGAELRQRMAVAAESRKKAQA